MLSTEAADYELSSHIVQSVKNWMDESSDIEEGLAHSTDINKRRYFCDWVCDYFSTLDPR